MITSKKRVCKSAVLKIIGAHLLAFFFFIHNNVYFKKFYQEFHGRTKFFCDIKIFMYSVRCYMNGKTPPKIVLQLGGKNNGSDSPSPIILVLFTSCPSFFSFCVFY